MLTAGPLIRRIAAKFCDSAETCALSLVQSDAAEHAQLWVDGALLERLLDNLLGNSVRHNPQPVQIRLQTDVSGGFLCIMVSDDGAGYPPDVLAALHAPEPLPNAPHILGLHVVEQIAAAHGGSAVFSQDTPHGAKAVVPASRWQGKTQVSDSIKNAPDSSKYCQRHCYWNQKKHLFRDDFQPGDSLRLGLTGPTGLFLAARRRFGQAALTARRAVIHYRLFSPYRPPKAKKNHLFRDDFQPGD